MSGFFDSDSMIFKAILSATWEEIDQNFYTKLAQCIDPIDSTITFYAEILSSGILKSFNSKGEDVTETDELIKLLRNPNENQNFQQFIKEWLYYHYSHGWNYVVPRSSAVGFEKKITGSTTTYLYNCDPDSQVFNNNSSFFSYFGATSNKDITFNYKPLSFTNIPYSNVIPFFDVRQNSQKPYVGVSRLLALKEQIKNFSLAQQAKTNTIKRSGSQLISLDVTRVDDIGMDDVVGTGTFDKDGSPITSTHKQKLEEQIRSTGIGNNSQGVIMSTLPLKVQPLSAGLENLKFDEYAIEDARQILNKYNVPKEFQNLTKETAKFANRQMAMIEVVQNTVDPLAKSFCDKMKNYFNWENDIQICFDHLPVFADNEQIKVETQQSIVTMYKGLLDAGTIDQTKFRQILTDYGIIK